MSIIDPEFTSHWDTILTPVPSAPTDLAASRPSSTSIEVTWTPPPLGDATNGYIIYYTNTLSGSTDSVNITGRSTNTYTLTGVSPTAEYNISIVATSQHFFSNPVSICKCFFCWFFPHTNAHAQPIVF